MPIKGIYDWGVFWDNVRGYQFSIAVLDSKTYRGLPRLPGGTRVGF